MEIKDKTFRMEVTFKVEVTEQESFPDAVATSFLEKIKTKIHCNRETMELVGVKSDIWEVYEEPDDEEN